MYRPGPSGGGVQSRTVPVAASRAATLLRFTGVPPGTPTWSKSPPTNRRLPGRGMLNTPPLTRDFNVLTTLPVGPARRAVFGAETPPLLGKTPPTNSFVPPAAHARARTMPLA